jgi:hypothetical protein
MDANQIRQIAEEVVGNKLQSETLIVFLLLATMAGLGAYLGAYLQRKGRLLADKDNQENAIELSKQLTAATEEIKRQIQRRSNFHDTVLMQRYNLVTDIDKKLNSVRYNYERMRQGRQLPPGYVVDGETMPLTEILEELQVRRSALGAIFHEKLCQKYELAARELWRASNESWEPLLKEWDQLSAQIQEDIERLFKLGEATI